MLERLREMDALSFFCIVVLLLFFGVAHGREEEKMNPFFIIVFSVLGFITILSIYMLVTL